MKTSTGTVIRRRISAWLAVAALLLCGSAGAQPGVDQTTALCTTCHRDKFETTVRNPHDILGTDEWQERTGNSLVCLNCHNDADDHISAGGGLGNILAFREESATAQNDQCLSCHGDSHPEFESSEHSLAGLTCASCHSQHSADESVAALLRLPIQSPDMLGFSGSSALCVDCHAGTASDFAFNERHRLTEGVLECTSCHDPHARESRSLLGGFRQQQCMGCHNDKGGPFVFEHAASRVDGCSACHSPHGSPNRYMLTHQRVGELCYSCHAEAPQFHSGFSPVGPPRFNLDTQCVNCHVTIHGSNLDPVFLR
jgi:DmsE family decaheme c-type cytochrome